MRTSLASTPAAAGRLGRGILLAAALCACGGGEPDPPAARTAAAPSASAAAAACTPPPAADTTMFTGSWATLTRWLADNGASFPDVEGNRATASVPLCPGCASVSVELRSDTTTYCTTPRELEQGATRVMGLMVLRGDFPGGEGWPPMQANDSILMFASDTSGPATMVYRSGANAAKAPAGSWQFYYCPDGHRSTRPEAQWRPRGRPADAGGRRKDREEDDGGTYGWMACASGCCQFYTPPPNETLVTTPERANPAAPDTVGPGRNASSAAPAWGRPYWCTGA